MSDPTLGDLWQGSAEFRCEDAKWMAMSVDIPGNGKLGLERLKDGRIFAVYRHSYRDPHGTVKHEIRMAWTDDGLNFRDHRAIASKSGWDSIVSDPGVLVFEIQNVEHIFVFYEAGSRQASGAVAVNTGMMWSTDQGKTWDHNPAPLTESKDIPDWGMKRFRGTSVPSAVIGSDRKHLWIYWTGLYGENPNHCEVGAGYIGIVRPGTNDWLSLEDGGVLEKTDGSFRLTIDAPQRQRPVLELGPYRWCSGGVDLSGNVVWGEDGYFYTVFRGGCHSEGEKDDLFPAGLARTSGMVSFEKRPSFDANYGPQPIVMPTGAGVDFSISYPFLFKHRGSWYLYYVCDKMNGPVPKRSSHFRLKLQ